MKLFIYNNNIKEIITLGISATLNKKSKSFILRMHTLRSIHSYELSCCALDI